MKNQYRLQNHIFPSRWHPAPDVASKNIRRVSWPATSTRVLPASGQDSQEALSQSVWGLQVWRLRRPVLEYICQYHWQLGPGWPDQEWDVVFAVQELSLQVLWCVPVCRLGAATGQVYNLCKLGVTLIILFYSSVTSVFLTIPSSSFFHN